MSSTTSTGRVAPASSATTVAKLSADCRARRSAASSPARCMACAHWSASVVAAARSAAPGVREAVKVAIATPRQLSPIINGRQASPV